jgi:hypothetical protein
MLHQRPDVAVELLLLWVRKLGQVAQKRHCGSDVLPGPCKLQGAIGVHDDGLLDLTGACMRAARNVTSLCAGGSPTRAAAAAAAIWRKSSPCAWALARASAHGSGGVCVSSISIETGCRPCTSAMAYSHRAGQPRGDRSPMLDTSLRRLSSEKRSKMRQDRTPSCPRTRSRVEVMVWFSGATWCKCLRCF